MQFHRLSTLPNTGLPTFFTKMLTGLGTSQVLTVSATAGYQVAVANRITPISMLSSFLNLSPPLITAFCVQPSFS